MDSKPKYLVSIYATVYNNAKYVKDSIYSIINQFTDFDINFEMVIVDNYSDDGTFEIIQDLQKEHRSISVIRERCTRGKGRAIAYNKSSGKFVFTVDLDSVYLRSLSYIVKYALENYEENTIFSQILFCSRDTMDLIGNWVDANEAEPFEFLGRALSKGVKIYFVPVFYVKNAVSKDREKRYAGKFLRYAKRGFNYYIDRIQCEGITSRRGLLANSFKGKILINLAYIYIKLKRMRVYRYSDYLINSFFVNAKAALIDPKKLDILKEFYGYYFYTYKMPFEIAENIEKQLKDMLIDKKMVINGKITFFYSESTAKEYIDYLMNFYNVKSA